MSKGTKWILLVDDESEIRNSVRELLYVTFGENNIKIVEADNGLDANGKVKNQKFDCIITDMKMPKKEGDALIVSVRQNPFNADTPVIMLTAFPNQKTLNEFRFVYLLEKPYRHDQLTDLVSTQLKVGNKGDRLAADMVNNLIGATKAFLLKVLTSEEHTIESPIAKKTGEYIQAEYVSQVNLFDDGIHNSFSILASESDLRKIAENMESIQNSSLDRIGYALGQSILKHAIKNMIGRGGLTYNIHTLDKNQIADVLNPKRGIIIPISCAGVSLKVLACGEKKKSA